MQASKEIDWITQS